MNHQLFTYAVVVAAVSSMAWLAGCASPENAATTREAQLFVQPNFKYTNVPKFSFTRSERSAALQEYRRLRGDILFEVLINRDGQAVGARVVRTQEDDYMTAAFRTHVLSAQYSEDISPPPYRMFFLPLDIDHSLELH